MRITIFLLTLLLLGPATPDVYAQTEGPPEDEQPAASDEPAEESAEATPTEEAAGEDEGARPPTTKEGDEDREAAQEDTEPIDTDPTMFTNCSHADASPSSSWLLVALIAGLVRRRRTRRTNEGRA